MAQWSNNDAATNSVLWGAMYVFAGSGPANQAANNTKLFKNTTPDSFKTGEVLGQYPVTLTEMANNTADRKGVTHAGWNLRYAWEGPLVSLVASNGSGFANGETALITNGTVNAVVSLTTNVTGNLVSATVVTPGQFANAAIVAATAFQRQQHILSFTLASALGVAAGKINVTGTALGFSNTDFVTVTNSAYGVIPAVANVSTNTLGGTLVFTLSNTGSFAPGTTNTQLVITAFAANGSPSNGTGAVFASANLTALTALGYNNTDIIVASNGILQGLGTITTNTLGGPNSGAGNVVVGTVGLFGNAVTNVSVVVLAKAANGAPSNGFGGYFSANLGTSTGGVLNAPVLGGRAGRFQYETLVAMGSCGGTGTFVGN